jgi:hypothetical protein
MSFQLFADDVMNDKVYFASGSLRYDYNEDQVSMIRRKIEKGKMRYCGCCDFILVMYL